MRLQNLFVMVLGVSLIGAIASYLVSPTYPMSELHEAAIKGDTAELEQRVDFPAFRESVKSEFRAQLEAELEKEKQSGNSLVALGGALAMGLIDPLIDRLVTPEGIRAIVASGRLDDGAGRRAAARNSAVKWTVERGGINRFFATAGSDRDDTAPSLVFERDGFGWKLVGMTFRQEQSEAGE